jgi:hypothetical protein
MSERCESEGAGGGEGVDADEGTGDVVGEEGARKGRGRGEEGVRNGGRGRGQRERERERGGGKSGRAQERRGAHLRVRIAYNFSIGRNSICQF